MNSVRTSLFTQLLALGCVGSLALPAIGQQIGNLTIVDDDPSTSHPDLALALAFAQEGDVFLLKPGFYGFVEVQWVGVSLIAEVPGTAVFGSQVRVTNIGPDSKVVLSGLRNTPESGQVLDGAGLYVSGCDGPVHVEDCVFEGSGESSGSFYSFPAGDIRYSHDVRLVDCVFQGPENDPWDGVAGSGGSGLRALFSTLTISGGEFRAGGGSEATADGPAQPGRAAINLEGSTAAIEGAQCFAGAGGPGNEFPGGPGGSPVVYDGAPGGTALVVQRKETFIEQAPSIATLRGVQLIPGSGGAVVPGATSPQAGPTGVPSVVEGLGSSLTDLSGAPRSLQLDLLAQGGGNTTVAFQGAAGDQALLLVGQSAQPLYLEGQNWPLLMSPAGLSLFNLGVADANGQVLAQFQMPLLPPGTGSQSVALQAIALPANTTDLQTAPARELVLIEQGL